MLDPLSVIFVPGSLAAMLATLSPIGVLAHRWWRSRGLQRNARRCCGRCDAAFAVADELYWFGGLLVCAGCAATLRRRLAVALPAAAAVAGTFALTSGSALAVSLAGGGPELAWWLDGRWIPLLLPSVGVALATAGLVVRGKRANRLAADGRRALDPGHDPTAPVRLRLHAPARLGRD